MKYAMMKHVAMLLACLAMSCTTTTTDSTGTPAKNGKYTTRKVCNVTYSRKPTIGMAQKADAAIMRFLLIIASVGFIGLIAGVVSWWLDKARKFPCPWWDELIVAGGIIVCISLLGLLLYPWLKWILVAGAAGFIGYKVLKGIRHRDRTNGKEDAV
jgi:hypothetical protein